MMLRHARYNVKRRIFTREEDELILANSEGRVSQSELINSLRCGTETLQRRAAELGLTIRKKVHNANAGLRPKPRSLRIDQEPIGGHQETPHVGDDLLLQQLHQHYGERRYESLRLKGEEESR